MQSFLFKVKMRLFLKGHNMQYSLPVLANVARDAKVAFCVKASSLADKCTNRGISMKFRLDTKCQLA